MPVRAPKVVSMDKAVKDYDSRPVRRGLSRRPDDSGHYGTTGIWDDPTPAPREKGGIMVEHMVKEMVRQIHSRAPGK